MSSYGQTNYQTYYYDPIKGMVYNSPSRSSSTNSTSSTSSISSTSSAYYYNQPTYQFNPVRQGDGYSVSGPGNYYG